MNSGAKQSLVVPEEGQKRTRSNGDRRANIRINENGAQSKGAVDAGSKPRVFIAADNRLLREALSRMLVKGGNIEVAGVHRAGPFRTEDLLKEEANILLLTSRGSMNEDLSAIRNVRASAPNVQILLIGGTEEETEFLLCVRAGVRGYLPKRVRERRRGRGTSGAGGRGSVPGHTLRVAFPLFLTRSNFVSFRERAPADGTDAPRTAIDPVDR
jgi:CheY-like chemotaxis protein